MACHQTQANSQIWTNICYFNSVLSVLLEHPSVIRFAAIPVDSNLQTSQCHRHKIPPSCPTFLFSGLALSDLVLQTILAILTTMSSCGVGRRALLNTSTNAIGTPASCPIMNSLTISLQLVLSSLTKICSRKWTFCCLQFPLKASGGHCPYDTDTTVES